MPFFKGAKADALFHHFGLALEIVAVSFDELWKVSHTGAAAATATATAAAKPPNESRFTVDLLLALLAGACTRASTEIETDLRRMPGKGPVHFYWPASWRDLLRRPRAQTHTSGNRRRRSRWLCWSA